MIMTAEQAVAKIRPGQRVFIGSGVAQPLHLVRALVARHAELADTQVLSSLTLGDAPYAYKELADHFSVNTFFVSANVRNMIQEGYGDYTPISLLRHPRPVRQRRDAHRRRPDPGDSPGHAGPLQPGHLGGHRQVGGGQRRPGDRPGQPADAVDPGRQLRERARSRHPRPGGRAPDRDDLRRLHRRRPDGRVGGGRAEHHPGHRREHRVARGGRIHPRGGHRAHPPRGRPAPQGQEGPGHPHRDHHRRDHPSWSTRA